MYTIYKITNIVNNKIYIGQTSKSIQERFNEHCICAEKYKLNTHFAKAIRKYNKNSFKIEMIETNILNKATANEKEIFYIAYYNSMDRNIGYNSTPGGEGGNTYYNKTATELRVIKNKISKSNSGENNGKHTVIYMLNTNTNKEIRFGSLSLCDKYLKDLGYSFKGRIYDNSAKNNRDYGIQHRWFNTFIFRFEYDNYYKWTDYPTKSGTFPYKIINIHTNEEFIGICKEECLLHFKLTIRGDRNRLEQKGYKLYKLEKNEYKNTLE